jgi:hypothetical protein
MRTPGLKNGAWTSLLLVARMLPLVAGPGGVRVMSVATCLWHAEQDIDSPGVCAAGVVEPRPHQQVIGVVVADIARGTHSHAGEVPCCLAEELDRGGGQTQRAAQAGLVP